MKLYAIHKNIETYFSEFKDGQSLVKIRFRIKNKYDICPFCKEYIKEGVVFLLTNNYQLFPNSFAHKNCCEKFKTRKEAIQHLSKDYEKALKCKHWFNI